MRRVWRLGILVTAALFSIAGVSALYIALSGLPRYDVERIDLHVDATPESVARGKNLATMLCVDCHLSSQTRRLTGRRIVDSPPEFGVVFSSNITADPEKGIGGWTDGEIAYLLRTGVRRDGRYVPPWMLKLPHMADDDLNAIIAFLRSNDPLVAAANVDPAGVSQPSFLTKVLCRVAFGKIPYPKHRIETPNPNDKIAYGRYLIAALDCYGCHSAAWSTMNIGEPERSAGYLGGGNELIDLRGKPIHSANLTFDEATGIGKWSVRDLTRALRDGFRPDDTPIRAPMAPMPQLTDDDIGALYAYLQTVPKIRNAVPRANPANELPSTAVEGKRIYYKYACVSCHGETGKEGQGDLTQASQHFVTRDALKAWIRNAPSLKPGTRMPRWDGVIPEADYDPLIDYVLALGASR